MADTVKELLVFLGVTADTDEIKGFDEALEKVKTGMETAVKWAAGLTAGFVAAAGAAGLAATGAADHAAAVTQQADVLGMTTDALQEYKHVFDQLPDAADELVPTLSALTKASQEVLGGSEDMAAAFGKLGVRASDLKNKRPDQVFEALADGFAKTADPVKRLDALMVIFGEDVAAKVGPALAGGADGIRALREQARAYGLVVDKDMLQRSAQARVQFQVFRAVLGSIRLEIGNALIPVMMSMTSRMLDWIGTNRKAISMRIDQAVVAIGDAFKWVETKVKEADEVVEDRFGGWKNLLTQLLKLATALGGAFALFKAIRGLMVLKALIVGLGAVITAVGAPIVFFSALAVGAFAAIMVAVDDLYAFMQGGPSVFGRFAEAFGVDEQIRQDIFDLIEAGRELFAEMKVAGSELAATIKTELKPLLDWLVPLLKGLVNEAGATYLKNLRRDLRDMIDLVRLATLAFRDFDAFVDGFKGKAAEHLDRIANESTMSGWVLNNVTAGGAGAAASFIADNLRQSVAPPPRGGMSSSSISNRFGDLNMTVHGGNVSEIESLLRRHDESQRKQAAAAFSGGSG